MSSVLVNGRKLAGEQAITGIPRYIREILNRSGMKHQVVMPPSSLVDGLKGNLWDQFLLPAELKGRLLWSPNNTGPILVKNQVVTIHDVTPLEHPEWFPRNYVHLFRFVVPRLVHRVRRVITVSEYSKRKIIEYTGAPEDKVIVIPAGVDHERFYPRTKTEIEAALSKVGIPTRKYVLCIGAIDPRKNLKGLINAWTRVRHTLPEDTWLIITGTKRKLGLEEDALITQDSGSRIHFTGFVDDEFLPGLISGAYALVFPSFYEGFGLPPLEAMACGVPAITSDRTSLPEVVGDAGWFVNPDDETSIAEGIRQLVLSEDLRSRLSRLSLLQAKKFDWAITAQHTWDVLRGEADACQR